MSTLPPRTDDAPDADTAGAEAAILVGRYRIGTQLGEGGMGAVYRGEHLGLRKPVAIKLLHRMFAAHDEMGARFQRSSKRLLAAQGRSAQEPRLSAE